MLHWAPGISFTAYPQCQATLDGCPDTGRLRLYDAHPPQRVPCFLSTVHENERLPHLPSSGPRVELSLG